MFCLSSQGVLSLKNSYFEPRYILLIPTQVEQYTRHMRMRGLYTRTQIDTAVARIKLYANINRQRPGFFDNVIPCGTAKGCFVICMIYPYVRLVLCHCLYSFRFF